MTRLPRLCRRCIPVLAALLAGLALAGCPADQPAGPDSADFLPAAPLPEGSALLSYDKLKLGMGSVDISQAYNAPTGQGDGFVRLIEDFGDNHNHLISFDTAEGQPDRRMVLRVYRDQLIQLVDRRDGLTHEQTDAWLAELKEKYGGSYVENPRIAQWTWGDPAGLMLVFTRDEQAHESANVVIRHKPSYDASLAYAAAWDSAQPDR